MLKNLYIKNFILIDSINLQFNDGFSVFTGETGAGKSIFIDGISILTGSKMTTSMIKQGCNKAIIEGEFSLTDEIKEKLNEAGFDDETLIISREINQEGKSSTRVNQRACSVSFIKDLLLKMNLEILAHFAERIVNARRFNVRFGDGLHVRFTGQDEEAIGAVVDPGGHIGVEPVAHEAHFVRRASGDRRDHVDGFLPRLAEVAGLHAGGGRDQRAHRAAVGHVVVLGRAVDVHVGRDERHAVADVVADFVHLVVSHRRVKALDTDVRLVVDEVQAAGPPVFFQKRRPVE